MHYLYNSSNWTCWMYTSIFFQLDLVGVFQWHTGGVSQNTATGRYYVHQLKGNFSFWGEFCDPTREMKLKRCVPTAQFFQCPEKEGKNDAEKKKKCIYLMHFTAIWLTRLCFSPSYIVTSGVCRKRLFAITLKMGGDLWVWQTAEESPRVCNTLGSINEDAEKACSILSLP